MILPPNPFGQPRRHVSSCTSTNDLARAWAADPLDPAPHGALVTADFQTQGRGRRGRRWDAGSAQSALMSFVLRPEIPLREAWHLGFLAALAVAQALHDLALDARLKWPNDVLLDGAKIAGVLVEIVPTSLGLEAGGAAIAGIGLNVAQETFADDDYAYPPTSLRLVTGRLWPVEEVIQAVAAACGHWAGIYRRDGFAPVHRACHRWLAIGAEVRRGEEHGTLADLTPEGYALVRRADGTFVRWTALEG